MVCIYVHGYTQHSIGNLSSPQSNCGSELFFFFTIYKHPSHELCKFDYSAHGLETFGSGWGPVVRPSEHFFFYSFIVPPADYRL